MNTSQLYGSTAVVMATHGLHWKWQSLTPCQTPEWTAIEKIFGMIDYVIDLNNLAKFGFGKNFPDGGTHTQHIRVRPFFKNFLRSLMRVQPKRLNRFWRAICQSTPFGEVRPFSRNEKYRSKTLTLKRSKSAILFDPQNFDPNFLENGTR